MQRDHSPDANALPCQPAIATVHFPCLHSDQTLPGFGEWPGGHCLTCRGLLPCSEGDEFCGRPRDAIEDEADGAVIRPFRLLDRSHMREVPPHPHAAASCEAH